MIGGQAEGEIQGEAFFGQRLFEGETVVLGLVPGFAGGGEIGAGFMAEFDGFAIEREAIGEVVFDLASERELAFEREQAEGAQSGVLRGLPFLPGDIEVERGGAGFGGLDQIVVGEQRGDIPAQPEIFGVDQSRVFVSTRSIKGVT